MLKLTDHDREDIRRAIEQIREFRKGKRLKAKSVRALIEEGRRF